MARPDCQRIPLISNSTAAAPGQSLAAFITRDLTLRVSGEVNDYAGKGLSGGKLIIALPRTAAFAAEDNILVGNVALYGAGRPSLLLRGLAGERFAVHEQQGQGSGGGRGRTRRLRVSMTGGVVVVLGTNGP